MPGQTVNPSNDEPCCCCGASEVLLHVIEPEPFLSRERHQHCDFCYETFAGSRCGSKEDFSSYQTKELMLHICAVANVLARKLKEGGRK
jgi:hypothetical protein